MAMNNDTVDIVRETLLDLMKERREKGSNNQNDPDGDEAVLKAAELLIGMGC